MYIIVTERSLYALYERMWHYDRDTINQSDTLQYAHRLINVWQYQHGHYTVAAEYQTE